MNAGTMSKTARKHPRPDANGMRAEYELDYSRAKPNRFASHMNQPVVAIVLEPDVASVFDSAAKVNAQLRSVMLARSEKTRPGRARGHRHKVG